jgi:hypothetical protein
MTYMGVWLANLIIPQNPVRAMVAGAAGTWELEQGPGFSRVADVEAGAVCAATYSAEISCGAAPDDLVQELRLLCIGASFLTGRAVTVRGPTPHSDWIPIRLSDGFPRDRAMTGSPGVASPADFEGAAAKMLVALPKLAATNTVDVLCHHLVSALSGWCLEDVFLNACTCMELIKWIGRRSTGNLGLHLNDALAAAGSAAGIGSPPADFSRMRNDIIHDGHLSASRFTKKTRQECADLATETLAWIDRYIGAITGVSAHVVVRFNAGALDGMNSFSVFP